MLGTKTLIVILIVLVAALAGLLFLKGLSGAGDEGLLEWLADIVGGKGGLNIPDIIPPGLTGPSATTIVSGQSAGESGLSIPNAMIAWTRDAETLLFSASRDGRSGAWAVGIDGTNLRELTAGAESIRSEANEEGQYTMGGSRGRTPTQDPLTGRIIYHAYSYTGFCTTGGCTKYHVIESVSLGGDDPQYYLTLSEKSSADWRLEMSPGGTMLLAGGAYLVKGFEPGSRGVPRGDRPFSGTGYFTSDGSGIVYKSGDAIYRYDIDGNSSTKIMDTACHDFGYCAAENLVACRHDTEGNTHTVFVTDLGEKSESQLFTESLPSDFSWSPDCSRLAYRSYNHTEGTMIRVVNV